MSTHSEESIRLRLARKHEGTWDHIVRPEDIKVKLENTLEHYVNKSNTDHKVTYHDSAFSQFLNRIQVPIHFYRRCTRQLSHDIIQHFVGRHKNSFLYRFDDKVERNHVRAVLSSSYSVVNDIDLFDIVFDVLKNRDDIVYRSLYYDNHLTRLLIDFSDAKGTYNDQEFTAGLSISNSETGHSAIWIEPVVHAAGYSFFNRKALPKQGINCRIIHRGNVASERVRPMVEQAKTVAQVGVTQLAEAFETKVTTSYALRCTSNMENLPSRFQQILEEEWQVKQELIKAEVTRRILQLAQELPLFQRVKVEQQASAFLGLFEDYQSRFSDLVSEINDE